MRQAFSKSRWGSHPDATVMHDFRSPLSVPFDRAPTSSQAKKYDVKRHRVIELFPVAGQDVQRFARSQGLLNGGYMWVQAHPRAMFGPV